MKPIGFLHSKIVHLFYTNDEKMLTDKDELEPAPVVTGSKRQCLLATCLTVIICATVFGMIVLALQVYDPSRAAFVSDNLPVTDVYLCSGKPYRPDDTSDRARRQVPLKSPAAPQQIRRIIRPLSLPPHIGWSFQQAPALYHDGAARCSWVELSGKKIAGLDEISYDYQLLELINCQDLAECRAICLRMYRPDDPNLCNYFSFNRGKSLALFYYIDPLINWNITNDDKVTGFFWKCQAERCDWYWRRQQKLSFIKLGEQNANLIAETHCRDFGACQRQCETHPTCNYVVVPTNRSVGGNSFLYSLPNEMFKTENFTANELVDSFEMLCKDPEKEQAGLPLGIAVPPEPVAPVNPQPAAASALPSTLATPGIAIAISAQPTNAATSSSSSSQQSTGTTRTVSSLPPAPPAPPAPAAAEAAQSNNASTSSQAIITSTTSTSTAAPSTARSSAAPSTSLPSSSSAAPPASVPASSSVAPSVQTIASSSLAPSVASVTSSSSVGNQAPSTSSSSSSPLTSTATVAPPAPIPSIPIGAPAPPLAGPPGASPPLLAANPSENLFANTGRNPKPPGIAPPKRVKKSPNSIQKTQVPKPSLRQCVVSGIDSSCKQLITNVPDDTNTQCIRLSMDNQHKEVQLAFDYQTDPLWLSIRQPLNPSTQQDVLVGEENDVELKVQTNVERINPIIAMKARKECKAKCFDSAAKANCGCTTLKTSSSYPDSLKKCTSLDMHNCVYYKSGTVETNLCLKRCDPMPTDSDEYTVAVKSSMVASKLIVDVSLSGFSESVSFYSSSSFMCLAGTLAFVAFLLTALISCCCYKMFRGQ